MMDQPIWWEYAEFYPGEDEEDYDGIHDGGIKGLTIDAPEKARKAYEEYIRQETENKKQGIKI